MGAVINHHLSTNHSIYIYLPLPPYKLVTTWSDTNIHCSLTSQLFPHLRSFSRRLQLPDWHPFNSLINFILRLQVRWIILEVSTAFVPLYTNISCNNWIVSLLLPSFVTINSGAIRHGLMRLVFYKCTRTFQFSTFTKYVCQRHSTTPDESLSGYIFKKACYLCERCK